MWCVTIFVYDLLCVSLCLYMTYLQFSNYAEDNDSSAISFRKFNKEPKDLYPSFSICFWGTKGEILNEDRTRQALNDTVHSGDVRSLYAKMLKGKIAMTEGIGAANFDDLTITLRNIMKQFGI